MKTGFALDVGIREEYDFRQFLYKKKLVEVDVQYVLS